MKTPSQAADVVVVGAGPAGLAAATALCRAHAGRVVVLEREAHAGGIPRHAHHQGFGLRDLHRMLAGPEYAARNVEAALRAGCELLTETQATGWTEDGELVLTSPQGRFALRGRAVVLATGCRERPRSARLVAGSRPLEGIVTVGTLQQRVYLNRERTGGRVIVVGAEHVGASALATLAHGGFKPIAMVTEQSRRQAFALFRAGMLVRFHVPLLSRTAVVAIHGRRRVEAVSLRDLDTGAVRVQECDVVVFSGDWIPDHELAVLGGATLDRGTRGPQVDAGAMTTRCGLFAAGNVVHGAEAADIAALSGRRAAQSVLRYLGGEAWAHERVPVVCEAPLRWVAPNAVSALRPPARLTLRAHEVVVYPRIEIEQNGRLLWKGRLPRLLPDRPARLPGGWIARVDLGGGPVTLRVA